MKKLYRDQSMKKRLYLVFFAFTLVPIIFIFVAGMIIEYKNETERSNTVVERQLNTEVDVMNKNIDKDIGKSEIISRSTIITDGLRADYTGDIGAVMSYYSELGVFMSGFDFQLINNNERCCIYTFNKSLPMSKYIDSVEELEKNSSLWTKLANSSNSDIVWDYSNIHEQYRYISLFRKIYYYEELLGFLEVRIYVEDLTYSLKNLSDNEEGYIVCKNPDGEVFYSDKNESEMGNGTQHTAKLNDGSEVIFTVNNGNILQRYYKYIILYFIGFVVLALVLSYAYRMMISSITKDLNEFIEVLRNNNLTASKYFEDQSVDPDIALIKKKFKNLIDQIHQMNREIIEIDKAKRSIELEFLQSGINPHLLYNSLSVIKWRMLRLNQTGIAKLIDNMTDYYRRIISDGNYIVTVREELELTDKYIDIVEFSYENEYRIIKDIDENALDCITIKLILQPIVENAILHGLLDKEDGEIIIKVRKQEKYLIFTITDNGYGMSEDDIKKALDTTKIPKRKGGYGISNTIKRIKAYYGNECGIEIKSKIGEGTTVVVNVLDMKREELMEKF